MDGALSRLLLPLGHHRLAGSGRQNVVLHTNPICRRVFGCLGSSNESSSSSSTFEDFVKLNPQINNEEWQRERRKETEELKKRRELEDKEEAAKTETYREIIENMEKYAEAEIQEARKLVASFIRAGEEIEDRIEAAAEEGKLTKVVLVVIQNRLELARHDDERHVVQALDLLYRRIEAEIFKKEASPAMRFLDELLNLNDGSNHEDWLRQCRQSMLNTFPREDAFSFLAPQGFDLESHQGPIDIPIEDDVLLRADFIREVDGFLAKIVPAPLNGDSTAGLDPQSVAIRLSQQQRVEAIQQVRDLLKLAIGLKW